MQFPANLFNAVKNIGVKRIGGYIMSKRVVYKTQMNYIIRGNVQTFGEIVVQLLGCFKHQAASLSAYTRSIVHDSRNRADRNSRFIGHLTYISQSTLASRTTLFM